MGHELTHKDKIVLHQTGAWHGMGIVLNQALRPVQAAEIAFPYTVRRRAMFVRDNKGEPQIVEGWMANVRSDDGEVLGVVSETGYQVVQPLEMAEFCEALADEGKVLVETAGSIRGGRRIWFLLKGEVFEVARGDAIMPYILVSNGYDGGTSFRVTPTTIRVVCSNTLHGVIPRYDTGDLGSSVISIRHTCNIKERLEEVKKALAGYGKAVESTKEVIKVLASVDVTQEQVQQFFLECYTADFGEIPMEPKDGYEARRRERAQSAYASFSQRFDDEKGIAGPSLWCAANAYSGLIQHDLKARGSDDADRVERRVQQNLFGLNQTRTLAAMQRAFRMAVSA